MERERPCTRWEHLYVPPGWSRSKVREVVNNGVRRGQLEECGCGFYRLVDARAVPLQ